MRNAETVLGIVRERGKQGKPLEDIYRMLYNRDLYLRAYARLYPNKGAMTPGTTTETVDGMSLAKIDAIIAALRQERYRWKPVRRVYIPKPNGKQRPLGLPSWSDKLLQEVMRSILEAYYEPQLSDHAHGFRPERLSHRLTGGHDKVDRSPVVHRRRHQAVLRYGILILLCLTHLLERRLRCFHLKWYCQRWRHHHTLATLCDPGHLVVVGRD